MYGRKHFCVEREREREEFCDFASFCGGLRKQQQQGGAALVPFRQRKTAEAGTEAAVLRKKKF